MTDEQASWPGAFSPHEVYPQLKGVEFRDAFTVGDRRIVVYTRETMLRTERIPSAHWYCCDGVTVWSGGMDVNPALASNPWLGLEAAVARMRSEATLWAEARHKELMAEMHRDAEALVAADIGPERARQDAEASRRWLEEVQ